MMPKDDLDRARQRVARIMTSRHRDGNAFNEALRAGFRAVLDEFRAEGDKEAERLLLIDDLAKSESDKRALQEEVDRLKGGGRVIDRG